MTTGGEISQSTGVRPARQWWIWALAVIIFGLAIWYCGANFGRWKDRFVPRKLRTVVAGQLYASGQIDRHLIRQVLADDHIKTIVCLVADDPNDPDVAEEIRAASDLGIERFNYPLSGDGTGDIHSYADAVAKIVESLKQGKPVLLHCSSGAQRSNGATFYYRVLVQQWDADSAAQEMFRNAHNPRENPMLIPYLNQHMAEMAQLLVDRSIIDRTPDPLPQIHHD
jgi:protein tyrosine phosphatase (PTP) superfamily phosphohydrolase (DUF442 family)